MKHVEVDFKFEIGDVMEHVAVPDRPLKPYPWGSGERLRYMIVTQIVEVCHGGIQIHYHGRVVGPNGTVNERVQDFLELELRPASIVRMVDEDAERAARNKVQVEFTSPDGTNAGES